MNEVSRDLCSKVGTELEKISVDYFKKHGLVKGKVSLRYGAEFTFKIEAHSNDEVSREFAVKIADAITDYAKVLFSENNLVLHKMASKYGSHFTLTITAEPLVLGRNNVNLGSEWARTFVMVAHKYEMSEADLGAEAVINGKRYVLLGADYKRNGDIHLVARRWDNNQTYIFKSDSIITYFGGKYEAPRMIGVTA